MASDENLSGLEERVSQLEEKQEVEMTVQRYVRGLDSQNSDLLRSIFAEDAIVDVVPWGYYEGREEIMDMYQEAWEEIPLMNHIIANQIIEIENDKAVVSSYWLSKNESKDNQLIKGGGFYIRELQKSNRGWIHTYFILDIEFLRRVDGPPFRKVMDYDELRPFPKNNPNFPVPFFPKHSKDD